MSIELVQKKVNKIKQICDIKETPRFQFLSCTIVFLWKGTAMFDEFNSATLCVLSFCFFCEVCTYVCIKALKNDEVWTKFKFIEDTPGFEPVACCL